MRKIIDFILQWWVLILLLIILILYLTKTHLPEGQITNKMHFPAYTTCTNKGCRFHPPSWIISVQNGDEFDSWYVSERYYDSVQIGDWVRK